MATRTSKTEGTIAFRTIKQSLKELIVPIIVLIIAVFSINLVFAPAANAQKAPIIQKGNYPKDYFGSPLNIPHQASGTFGELRSTHFHAGDDFRTQQRVGLPLFAVAEGYISRVRVQIGGGGNSIYITHPNGYTSVYLHMHTFVDKLSQRVVQEQYAVQRFDVDIELQPGDFPVKKGERIGTAGNSGSSQGPHLHFEIRDTKTQNPINPQLFGLHFPDKTPPLIQGITIYDLGDEHFNERTPRRHFKTKSLGSGKFALSHPNPIPVKGRIGIGIQTVDKHDETTFNNGVYSIELLADGQPVSTVVFERLSYTWSGAIHSYIDYPHYHKSKVRVQKSFKDPNSPVDLYYHLEKDGTLTIETQPDQDQKAKSILYRVKDVHGNTATLNFNLQPTHSYEAKRERPTGTTWFRYNKENHFASDELRIHIPAGALYNDLYFQYSQSEKPVGSYSLNQHVHTPQIPLFKPYELQIKADPSLPTHYQSKAVIVDEKGNSHGGRYKDGFVVTQTRAFGSFHIKLDTVAPTIRPINISAGQNLAKQQRIDFQISDNLSGIASFEGRLNGEWILFEYDPKNRRIWHTLSRDLHRGEHELLLEVKDRQGNLATYTTKFVR